MQDLNEAVDLLKEGGVGVLPTDTLYGLVGSALVPETVERIYELKRRDGRKPLIVLISHIDELEQFGIVCSEELMVRLNTYWPGRYSIILPAIDDQFDYLSRNTGTIAFRMPDKEDLLEILSQTGPLVAPSANIDGNSPAKTAEEARKYFGTDADFYIDGGELGGKPSTVLELDGEKVRVIRP
ncbi:MAG TPA: L-threonylcarbamoyladenylate synthase [Candidatus Paceibacterota bacterium]